MKRHPCLTLLICALALGGGCGTKEEGSEPAQATARSAEGDREHAAGDDGGGLAGETGVLACDSYVAAVSQYLSCDKLPQRTRDAARQGLEKMLKAWTQRGDDIGDASKKAAAASACKTALAALEMTAAASGCALE